VAGITRGTRAAHIARATLEAIAFQVDELVRAMSDDIGRPVARLRVDGGAAANDLLLALQADLSNLAVERPAELESTARGAAMLAGLGVGLFSAKEQTARMSPVAKAFAPTMDEETRRAKRGAWADAVRRARSF
jgi:glycerol kinase